MWFRGFFTGYILSVIILSTLICSIPVAVFALFDRQGNLQHLVGRLWSKIILLVTGIKVDVKGLENLIPEQPCILASNHQSLYDIPVLMGILPIQFRFIAKESLFRIPVFGWSMRLMKFISLERGKKDDILKSIREAIYRIKSGTSVIIFPEGTRSPDGNLQQFKKGAFLLAIKTGCPIIPVVIKGTKTILPKGKLALTPAKVELIVCPAILPEDFKEMDREALSQRVHEVMENYLK